MEERKGEREGGGGSKGEREGGGGRLREREVEGEGEREGGRGVGFTKSHLLICHNFHTDTTYPYLSTL